MKYNLLLLLAAATLVGAGCSSTPDKVDSGVIHARTFSFVDRAGKPPADYAENRPEVHAMLQESITKNLSKRGVTKVATGGDVTVAYLVIVGNNAYTTSINDYFGYGRDSAGLHDKAHTAYTDNKNPNYFEAGTLVIDLIDSKDFKLLKRSHVTRPMLRDLPADARAVRIQEAVDEVLRELRIAQ
jgi:hypothetical protein